MGRFVRRAARGKYRGRAVSNPARLVQYRTAHSPVLVLDRPTRD